MSYRICLGSSMSPPCQSDTARGSHSRNEPESSARKSETRKKEKIHRASTNSWLTCFLAVEGECFASSSPHFSWINFASTTRDILTPKWKTDLKINYSNAECYAWRERVRGIMWAKSHFRSSIVLPSFDAFRMNGDWKEKMSLGWFIGEVEVFFPRRFIINNFSVNIKKKWHNICVTF